MENEGKLKVFHLLLPVVLILVFGFQIKIAYLFLGLALVIGPGFLLTLLVRPTGISFWRKLTYGTGIGLLLAIYTAFWLAKLSTLQSAPWVFLLGFLFLFVLAFVRARQTVQLYFQGFRRALGIRARGIRNSGADGCRVSMR
jgi:hypothetical protein